MHQPIPSQGRWLKQVVTGHFARSRRVFRWSWKDPWRDLPQMKLPLLAQLSRSAYVRNLVCTPPFHKTNREGALRVEFTRSPNRPATPAPARSADNPPFGFCPRGGGGGPVDGKGPPGASVTARIRAIGQAVAGGRPGISHSERDISLAQAPRSGDERGGRVDRRPGRVPGRFPAPILALPTSVSTKPRVLPGREEHRIATVAELEHEHRRSSPICNARERGHPAAFGFSRRRLATWPDASDENKSG
jgi:hypothetical protein